MIFESLIEKFVGILAAAAFAFVARWLERNAQIKRERETEQKIQRIEKKAEDNPERVQYAWDVARIKLEEYFDKNLSQVSSIFWVGVFVMIVGFGFILFGIVRSFIDSSTIKVSYVAAAAGVVTEFIGATFMMIFRSTLQQATSYMSILDRINSVGMAVQILDSIGQDDVALKNSTRAEIVKMLLTRNGSTTIQAAHPGGIKAPKARAKPVASGRAKPESES